MVFIFIIKRNIYLYYIMITFILPISTGRDIELAINILMPSIEHFFNLEHLHKFFIILNNKDFDLFTFYINKTNYIEKLKIEIINENDLLDTNNIYNTYYLQMLLKFLIASKINTKYYLSLDADIYFCKKSDSTNFFDDKAYYYYKQIDGKKDKWLQRVDKYLDIDIKFKTNQTPFVFITELVLDMIKNIDVNDLILKKNCSEYTLYTGYLYKNNLFNEYYKNNNFQYKTLNYNVNKNEYIDNTIHIGESFILNDNQIINCIQSRLNQHHKLSSILKQFIPNITYTKNKIALLTVVSDGEYFETYKKAFYTKKNYCEYHNYDFVFEIVKNNTAKQKYPKNKGWMKIYKLKEIILKYDYVFMSDADVIITNRDIRITDIINIYGLDNKMFLITQDYNSLNSGNIIWRNCPETVEFLNKMINLDTNININEPYKNIGIYEQPKLIYLINTNEYYRNNIHIIPQKIINSYNKLFSKDENGLWKNGDFLIHFAGANYNINKDIVKNEVDKYVAIYKINIIKKEGYDYGNIF
jgi:hypothetical protein